MLISRNNIILQERGWQARFHLSIECCCSFHFAFTWTVQHHECGGMPPHQRIMANCSWMLDGHLLTFSRYLKYFKVTLMYSCFIPGKFIINSQPFKWVLNLSRIWGVLSPRLVYLLKGSLLKKFPACVFITFLLVITSKILYITIGELTS